MGFQIQCRFLHTMLHSQDTLTFFQIQASEWKVDDSRILFFHEHILREAFEMQDDIPRQPLTFESTQLTGRFLMQIFQQYYLKLPLSILPEFFRRHI